MAKKDVHTVPWKGRWANKRESQVQVRKTYKRQAEAIGEGRVLARQSKAEHFIHRRDGSIRTRNSYGHDLVATKG